MAAGKPALFGPSTVYALMADACNGAALDNLYLVKGRPGGNPLMVIVADREMANRYACLDEGPAAALTAALWPAPLTVCVRARPDSGIAPQCVNPAGYIGVCFHNAPYENRIVEMLGRPVASSSANHSGFLSPTRLRDIPADLLAAAAVAVDSGPMPYGLESTLVSFQFGGPVLLRPGAIERGAIETALGCPLPDAADHPDARRLIESGRLPTNESIPHYNAGLKLRLNALAAEKGEAYLGFGPYHDRGPWSLSRSGDLSEAAANLYSTLHDLQRHGHTEVAVAPIPSTGLGATINHRLITAARAASQG
ncbi:L-threonylcarbamoyladenylate synthase [Azospirillum sp. B506]|uniref:L-threonylcarbamoyladenylate synthase n=1 Tax=Azospirillum sp. B506 TaxID=137721 RepID=UPI0005B2BB69|nr:Sua5/YciO/YrdC/YwlC family protein [Azospirillum sp. B506]